MKRIVYGKDWEELPTQLEWNKLYGANIWMKLATFLFTVVKRCIITWENLHNKGFVGCQGAISI